MSYTFSRNVIAGEFFTVGSRISCRLAVPVGGLNALLMDPLHSYLELEDAYVSRINTPGEIVGHYEVAAIRKENVLFILLPRVEEGTLPKSGSGFIRPILKDAFVLIPSFEIQGKVETDPNTSPRDLLIQSMGRFIPIHDATATVALFPRISFGGKLVLVNKERVETLCIE
jgi:hypothetical protein